MFTLKKWRGVCCSMTSIRGLFSPKNLVLTLGNDVLHLVKVRVPFLDNAKSVKATVHLALMVRPICQLNIIVYCHGH